MFGESEKVARTDESLDILDIDGSKHASTIRLNSIEHIVHGRIVDGTQSEVNILAQATQRHGPTLTHDIANGTVADLMIGGRAEFVGTGLEVDLARVDATLTCIHTHDQNLIGHKLDGGEEALGEWARLLDALKG